MNTQTVFNCVYNLLIGGFVKEQLPGLKWDWEELAVRQDLEASTSLSGQRRYLQTHE
jgi:hypothetical protein